MEVKEARMEVENGEERLGIVMEEGAEWEKEEKVKEKTRWEIKEGV